MKKGKRLCALALALVMVLTLVPGITQEALGSSDSLIILQTYGGGGPIQNDTPISHSFIELYNPTDQAVDLTGWKVTYHDERSSVYEWEARLTEGLLQPGHSYLIRGKELKHDTDGNPVPLRSPAYEIDVYDLDMPNDWLDNRAYEVKLVNPDGDVINVMNVSVPNKHNSCRRENLAATNYKLIDYRNLSGDSLEAVRPRWSGDGVWSNKPPLSLPSGYDTAEANTLWFAGTNIGNGADAVLCKREGNTYRLFLPPSANLENIRVWHNFTDTLTVGGAEIVNGETTAAFQTGGQFELKSSGNTYTLEILQSKNVGAVFLNIDAPLSWLHESKTNECPGTALVVADTGKVEYSGALDRLRGRGETSWRQSKKSYNVKFPNAESLFGMTSSKKYSLIPNALDYTMLRNKMMYDFASAFGMPYSTKSHYVELYVDGSYLGAYLLTEKIEIGKNNVINDIGDLIKRTEDINDNPLESYPSIRKKFLVSEFLGLPDSYYRYYDIPNDPEDITGPYLLEGYYKSNDECWFQSRRNGSISLNGPASKKQVEYIRDFYQDMEDAVFSPDGMNAKGRHFTEYLDVESAAKVFLIQEYSKNYDGANASVYFWKESDIDGDGKLHYGPVWDFDHTFGNAESWGTDIDLKDPDTWWMPNCKLVNGWTSIFGGLWQHEAFKDAVMDCREEFADTVEIFLGIKPAPQENYPLKSIEEYATILVSSAGMNYEKDYNWSSGQYTASVASLRSFAEKRYDFMMKQGFDKDFADLYGRELDDLPMPPKPPEPPSDSVTLYYYNNEGWATVGAFAWEPDAQFDEWPGEPCYNLGNGWWSIDLPVFEDGNHIIFNDQNINYQQTSDKLLEGNKIFFWGSLFDDGGNGTTGYTYAEAVAQWDYAPLPHYTVSFNTNGGGTVNEVRVSDGSRISEPPAPKKPGYAFMGWYKDKNSLTNKWNFAMDTVTWNTTLYAKWVPIYTLTVNAQPGGIVNTKSGSYAAGAVITLSATANTGYVFDGWTASNGGSFGNAAAAKTTFTMPANATSITAKFKRTYTVTYNKNGATGGSVSADSTKYKTGEKVTIKGNTGKLVRTGYVFAGWTQNKNGSGTVYKAGSKITVGSTNITLYAKWSKTYKVTYNKNKATGGKTPTDKKAYTSGAKATVLGNTGKLVRKGYIFAGWTQNKNGSGTVIKAKGKITLTKATTLYAKWTPVKGRITPTSNKVGKNRTLTLTAKGNASIRSVLWSSSKPKNVSITRTSGTGKIRCIVKGLKKGKKSTITAKITFKDGTVKKVTRNVSVKR